MLFFSTLIPNADSIDIIGYKSFDFMTYLAIHLKNIGPNPNGSTIFQRSDVLSIVNLESLVL